MRYTLAFLVSFLLIITSCKKNKEQKNTPVQKTGMNAVANHTPFAKIDEASIKEIKDWKEYFIVEEFMEQFEKTSATEALNNAIELKTLTKQLKDSLNIETLKTSAFKARINVFQNEVLRLTDMTFIPSITSQQVNSQVEKTLALFGSMNDKINTVYAKKRFDKAIKLDSLFTIE
ncbi:hypothetical protein H3Z83_11755 [Tenacibaculum sp. S7007]|uniref:Uncharacterized protein n=1 Tax=Tenacibaculum pelagium TaxID=2759527 RepID=A0A839AS75_9FLAO|nr:hypothetical protein [Tenacibaculum pelagium]MBA6157188.1 hypothetical protein [Tenacibaculum pelagium]